ncbi:MAG: hypothetical protein LBO73_01520 [Holosporaceae bacterium]|nr:hypothetical protein [Holosporaceae bacterium]
MFKINNIRGNVSFDMLIIPNLIGNYISGEDKMSDADVRGDLDALIRDLGIIDANTGCPPASKDELRTVKIQLRAARIIADDIYRIRRTPLSRNSDRQVIRQLVDNWTENIKEFALALIERDSDRNKIKE